MLDFDVPLRSGITKAQVKTTQTVQTQITETVRVVSNQQVAGFLAKPERDWNWTDLRDYIAAEVERHHGPQTRDSAKESGIVKSFISRWGIETAVLIAQAAFEVYGGMWRNAPITMTRFTKNSDPYFAQVIVDKLTA